jgi:phosphoglycolate phosphatase-like HAD superfamily hydrolase
MVTLTRPEPRGPIIFLDFDGTLVDIRQKYFALHCHLARKLDFNPGFIDDFWRLKRGQAQSIDLTGGRGASVAARYERLWLELIETPTFTSRDTVLPGVAEVLHGLRDSTELALVTLRRDPLVLRKQLQYLHLNAVFGEILVSGEYPDVARSKPSLIQHSRWKGRRPAMVVGDTADDAAAAASLDIPFIAVNSGLRDASKFRDQALAVIDTAADLPEILPLALDSAGNR